MDLPVALNSLLDLFNGHQDLFNYNSELLVRKALSQKRNMLFVSVTSEGHWSKDLGLILLWRAFLNILPASVLENPEERCKDVVAKRLFHLLGEPPDKAALDKLMLIVKRLQMYQISGRRGLNSSTLDLSLTSHLRLLRRQSGRCNCCGYLFSENDLHPDQSAHRLPTTSKPLSNLDRSPRQLRRKAELDHIFPIYLAGDNDKNWQILCQTCNRGKSDLLFGFEGRSWFGTARLRDLTEVHPQLFYMVLRRDATCSQCNRGPLQVELRIVRRDFNGADLYPNLVTHCTDCLLRAQP